MKHKKMKKPIKHSTTNKHFAFCDQLATLKFNPTDFNKAYSIFMELKINNKKK